MKNLQDRTKRFALDVIRFSRHIPKNTEGWVIRKQLIRSATSVGANYRAACQAHSRKAFIAKLSIVVEEADESQFWLEMLDDLDFGNSSQRRHLLQEAHELASIMIASKKTARRNL